MNDVLCETKTGAMETLRFKSRFDDFDPDHYYQGAQFNLSSTFMGHDGALSISATCHTSQYGIRRPVALSVRLYREWINQESCLTLQRIGVLCHAFLYAVDLDQHNSQTLEFDVPFFTQAVGYTPARVRAELIGGRSQHIYFDLA